MDEEKVIVIGTTISGELIVSCQKFTKEEALQVKMRKQFNCDSFVVLYPEDIEQLEQELDKFYK